MVPEGETGGRPSTTRIPGVQPRRGPDLTVILCAAGGAALLLLVVIITVASTGRGPGKPPPDDAPRKSAPETHKNIPPEIREMELQAKVMCEEGARLVKPRLKADASAPKENVRKDLERGIRYLKEGLVAYEKARLSTGKDYPTAEFARIRDAGIQALSADLEKEGHLFCEDGYKLIRSCESRMTGRALSDDEKRLLREDLQKGVALITDGMNLLDRSYQVSGNKFDVSKYGQARKLANNKLGELR